MSERREFRAVRESLWQGLAERLLAHAGPDGRWNEARIDVSLADWSLTLDSFQTNPARRDTINTRMIVPVRNPERFRFSVYRHDVFSRLGWIFGAQDIDIGDVGFDHGWVVKSSSVPRIRKLVDESIRAQLQRLPDASLALQTEDGVRDNDIRHDQLVLVCAGLLATTNELRSMYELLADTLERLSATAAE